MQCPSCDCQNSEVAKFCDVCGTALPLHCPACGGPNRTSAKFCSECGVALDQQPSPKGPPPTRLISPNLWLLGFALGTAVEAQSVPEGERKMVTALFVDIIEFDRARAKSRPRRSARDHRPCTRADDRRRAAL